MNIGAHCDSLLRFSIAVISIVAILSPSNATSLESRSVAYSAFEVRQQLARMLQKLDSLRVRYVSMSAINNPAGEYIARELVIKKPHWLHHKGTHGSKSLSWYDDPDQQHAWIQGDRYFNEFPLRRTYFSEKWASSNPLPGSLQKELWFELTGVWLLNARKPPQCWNLVPVLDEVVKLDRYVVRPHLEEVNGFWCHVLEVPGEDVLWIHVSKRGCRLMRREAMIPDSQRIFARAECDKHVEVCAGVLMPTYIRNQIFSWSTGEPVPYIDANLDVVEISANNVIEEEFQYRPKRGAIRLFLNSVGTSESEQQIAPGGLDYLDDLVEWIKRVHGAPPASLNRSMYLRRVAFGIAMGAILLAIVGWLRNRRFDRGAQ